MIVSSTAYNNKQTLISVDNYFKKVENNLKKEEKVLLVVQIHNHTKRQQPTMNVKRPTCHHQSWPTLCSLSSTAFKKSKA